MGFPWREKKAPPDVVQDSAGSQDTERVGAIHEHLPANLPVECPPHTTERKLVAKIDLHVVPWLCVMYLLAFLGKCPQAHKHQPRAASP